MISTLQFKKRTEDKNEIETNDKEKICTQAENVGWSVAYFLSTSSKELIQSSFHPLLEGERGLITLLKQFPLDILGIFSGFNKYLEIISTISLGLFQDFFFLKSIECSFNRYFGDFVLSRNTFYVPQIFSECSQNIRLPTEKALRKSVSDVYDKTGHNSKLDLLISLKIS